MRRRAGARGCPTGSALTSTRLHSIGGVPKAVVCDNLKAGVTTACRYEPGVNRTYQDLAAHYGTAILPTRVRKPRDKAKVEVAVQIVQRFVLARLRNRRFFSLAELNVAIRELVADLNAKIMRKLGASRRELFETIERPALKALADEPYQYAEWKTRPRRPRLPRRGRRPLLLRAVAPHPRGGRGAHHRHAPIEIFHRGVRVASHARLARAAPAHDDPRAHAERAPALRRVDAGAPDAGGRQDRPRHASRLCEAIMRAKPHPEQGFRACLGILRLARSYGVERARGGLPARHRHRRAHLRLDRLDPQAWPRPGLRARSSRRTAHRSSTATSAAVATTTEDRRKRC